MDSFCNTFFMVFFSPVILCTNIAACLFYYLPVICVVWMMQLLLRCVKFICWCISKLHLLNRGNISKSHLNTVTPCRDLFVLFLYWLTLSFFCNRFSFWFIIILLQQRYTMQLGFSLLRMYGWLVLGTSPIIT